jgi:hypothetical protein
MDGKRFLNLMDMFDGGGMGRAGSEFEGGPLSGLLNALGIRPMGAGRAMDQSPQPMPRPPGLGASGPAPAPMTPPPNPYAPGAITTTPLGAPGQMTDEDLVRYLLDALRAAPSAAGYGPR